MALCLDVREERHETRPLYRKSDLALFASLHAGAAARKHLRVRIGKLLQIRDILVIDELLVLYFFSESLVSHGNKVKRKS